MRVFGREAVHKGKNIIEGALYAVDHTVFIR